MEAFWQGLSWLNKAFAMSALLFSVIFVWQVISMLIGGDMDSHVQADGADMSHAPDVHDHAHHGADSAVTFTLVSFRSIVAFGALFSWSG
ncbi:MAG: hypothetical protein HY912_23125, partial [Desulfomonile tiedjei]|nr:hypothetical protein [Desulfomonile tiedjei]